jgi:hypothetical protein
MEIGSSSSPSLLATGSGEPLRTPAARSAEASRFTRSPNCR